MSCLGVHFALTEEEAAFLRALENDEPRLRHLQEALEVAYFSEKSEYKAESDRSWDAMHRALADGKLTCDGGAYPLNHTVLAGEKLYEQSGYIMSLKTPKQVRDTAAALSEIEENEFRRRYFRIDAKDYGVPLSEEDFRYTWGWFQEVRYLFSRAAKEGRFILFSADQ